MEKIIRKIAAAADEPALFDDAPLLDAPPAPAVVDSVLKATAKALPRSVRLGTSTWSFPGWRGIVYAPSTGERRLASEGLAAYSHYPIFRTVGLDRNFYRALSADAYAAFAGQVPEDFRFLVKAPREVTDPYLRTAAGRPRAPIRIISMLRSLRRASLRLWRQAWATRLGRWSFSFHLSRTPSFDRRKPKRQRWSGWGTF